MLKPTAPGGRETNRSRGVCSAFNADQLLLWSRLPFQTQFSRFASTCLTGDASRPFCFSALSLCPPFAFSTVRGKRKTSVLPGHHLFVLYFSSVGDRRAHQCDPPLHKCAFGRTPCSCRCSVRRETVGARDRAGLQYVLRGNPGPHHELLQGISLGRWCVVWVWLL